MKRIALIVGHQQDREGAYNETHKIGEWKLNNALVDDIISKYNGNFKLVKVLRKGYNHMINTVNELRPIFAISFHCNSAASNKATGSEAIYIDSKPESQELGKIILPKVVEALGLRNRGVKQPWQGRGGGLLESTKVKPIIILESFFINNDKDLERFIERRKIYIDKLIEGLEEAGNKFGKD